MLDYSNYFNFGAGPWTPTMMSAIIGLAAWSLIWKGIALWKSARLGEKWWFVALLIINTVGILEILYIFVFSRRKTVASPTQ